MTRILLPLFLLLLGAAALPAEASSELCRDVIDTGPTGFDPADSDGIRTKDVDCATARKLAAKGGPVAVQGEVELLGFTCRDRGMRRNGTFPARCRSGSTRVFWVLGNAERRCRKTVLIADPGRTARFWVQGLSCRRARYVLIHSDPFPPGWRTGRDQFTGDSHAWKGRGTGRVRIRYRYL